MKTLTDQSFRLEEMIELLIRIVGRSNEKISDLEKKIRYLEKLINDEKKFKIS